MTNSLKLVAAILSVLTLGGVYAHSASATKSFHDGYDKLAASDFEGAANAFKSGLKNDPKNALAHFYLGKAYMGLHKTSLAEEEFSNSLELNRNGAMSEEARHLLAELSKPVGDSSVQTVPIDLMCTGTYAVLYLDPATQTEQWSQDEHYENEGGYLLVAPPAGQGSPNLILPSWPKKNSALPEDSQRKIVYEVNNFEVVARVSDVFPGMGWPISGGASFNRITGSFTTSSRILREDGKAFGGSRSSGMCERARAPKF